MAEDKNVGERLASIEAHQSSQKEGQARIERTLDKLVDDLGSRNKAQDKLLSDLQSTLIKVEQRGSTNHSRIEALELLVQNKIDKVDAVNKAEIEPIREMLKRIDNHIGWAVKIVLGAVFVAVLSIVLVKADVRAPWEPARAAVAQPQTPPVQPATPSDH